MFLNSHFFSWHTFSLTSSRHEYKICRHCMADLYLPIQWNACADPVKIFQFLNKVVNKYYSLEQQGVKIKYTKYILTLWRSPIYRYNVCLCRSCYTITILKQLPVIWTIDSYKTITCKRVPLLFDVLKIKCVFSHIK